MMVGRVGVPSCLTAGVLLQRLYASPQGDHNNSYSLLGELGPCGATDKQTCLKTVVLQMDNRKNVGIASTPHPPGAAST